MPSDWAAQAAKRGLTDDQLVRVASIVEREAKYDADRPLVASVIFNRLADKMLLQMDATLGYVLPSHDGFYTYEELKFDSPYNTYLYPGLPPTAICNPGLASLTAAAHAPTSDVLLLPGQARRSLRLRTDLCRTRPQYAIVSLWRQLT